MGIVDAEPDFACGILPRQRLERKIDGSERRGEHDRRAALGIAEDEQMRGRHREADFGGFAAVVDTCKNGDVLRMKNSFKAVESLRDRVRTGMRDKAVSCGHHWTPWAECIRVIFGAGAESTNVRHRCEVQMSEIGIPLDDLTRSLVVARPDDVARPHIGLVGDTYTILLSGKDTAGRYCLIDMHIPPGGGPPPHRHEFEESFTLLEGEMEATFRGEKKTVRAGETLFIPANAPHQFRNVSSESVRLLCLCSPAGQEEFFAEVGVPVATRTTPPPRLSEEERAAFRTMAEGLAPKYRTELLEHA